MTSLALTLGPTLLFLSRTPAVVKMAGDLVNGSEDEEEQEKDGKKNKENANKDEWADEPAEMLPTILARF